MLSEQSSKLHTLCAYIPQLLFPQHGLGLGWSRNIEVSLLDHAENLQYWQRVELAPVVSRDRTRHYLTQLFC